MRSDAGVRRWLAKRGRLGIERLHLRDDHLDCFSLRMWTDPRLGCATSQRRPVRAEGVGSRQRARKVAHVLVTFHALDNIAVVAQRRWRRRPGLEGRRLAAAG